MIWLRKVDSRKETIFQNVSWFAPKKSWGKGGSSAYVINQYTISWNPKPPRFLERSNWTLFFSRCHCNNQRVVLHTKGIVGILERNTLWRWSCSIVISRPTVSLANVLYLGRAATGKWTIPWPRSTTLLPALSKRLHGVRRCQSPPPRLFAILSSPGDRFDRRGHRGEARQGYRREKIWIWGGQRVPRLQGNWLVFRGWGLRRLQQQRFMRLGWGGLLRVSNTTESTAHVVIITREPFWFYFIVRNLVKQASKPWRDYGVEWYQRNNKHATDP